MQIPMNKIKNWILRDDLLMVYKPLVFTSKRKGTSHERVIQLAVY